MARFTLFMSTSFVVLLAGCAHTADKAAQINDRRVPSSIHEQQDFTPQDVICYSGASEFARDNEYKLNYPEDFDGKSALKKSFELVDHSEYRLSIVSSPADDKTKNSVWVRISKGDNIVLSVMARQEAFINTYIDGKLVHIACLLK
jgi:hypothetical protein